MNKTNLLTFFAFLISMMMYSQVPQEFSYQSVIRDNSGKLMINKDLSVNVSITKNGISAFSESHSVKTSSNGLISLNIGSKNPSSFSNIDWANGSYNIEVSISDSNGLTINTESKLLSVPYALYAMTPAGPSGSDGAKGDKGDIGPAGAAGAKGDKEEPLEQELKVQH